MIEPIAKSTNPSELPVFTGLIEKVMAIIAAHNKTEEQPERLEEAIECITSHLNVRTENGTLHDEVNSILKEKDL